MKQRHRDIIGRDVEALRVRVGDDGAPAHISGHGYGSVVALQFAIRFPDRVASLTLYEPADFITLFEDGLHTAEARRLRKLHATVVGNAGHAFGRWRAAREFVEFWSGPKTWRTLGTARKARYVSLVPRFAVELDALMSASAVLGDTSALTMPVTILCRERARRPLRRVCELLNERVAASRYEQIDAAAFADRIGEGVIHGVESAVATDTSRADRKSRAA